MVLVEKYVGTGNDFLIIKQLGPQDMIDFEQWKNALPLRQIVQKLCHRHQGLGADGLILARPAQDHDNHLKWEFYNSDGSSAEMCGNAARCIGAWARDQRLLSEAQFRLETLSGVVKIRQLEQNQWQVSGPLPRTAQPNASILERTKNFDGVYLINSGVPHLVLRTKEKDEICAHLTLARELRSHPDLGPRGANVTFYKVIDPNRLESLSFERGIEAFTLACGTGVIASFFAHSIATGATSSKVQVPGGLLTVLLDQEEVHLIGPAHRVYSMNLDQIHLPLG